MSVYNREGKYITLLGLGSKTVKELSERMFISEPTVRRDIKELAKRDILECKRGIVSLKANAADKRIPLFIRDMEQNEAKNEIALKAKKEIKDGDVLFLDASTTAYHLIKHLSGFNDIIIITNGAKTALEAAAMGIKTICTGGEMANESFSYIGPDAERVLERYNADIAFFSCRGLTEDGIATDPSILENSARRIMIKNSKRRILLCDKEKFGKKFLNTLCNTREIDMVITD